MPKLYYTTKIRQHTSHSGNLPPLQTSTARLSTYTGERISVLGQITLRACLLSTAEPQYRSVSGTWHRPYPLRTWLAGENEDRLAEHKPTTAGHASAVGTAGSGSLPYCIQWGTRRDSWLLHGHATCWPLEATKVLQSHACSLLSAHQNGRGTHTTAKLRCYKACNIFRMGCPNCPSGRAWRENTVMWRLQANREHGSKDWPLPSPSNQRHFCISRGWKDIYKTGSGERLPAGPPISEATRKYTTVNTHKGLFFSTSAYHLALPQLPGFSNAPWKPSYKTSLTYVCILMISHYRPKWARTPHYSRGSFSPPTRLESGSSARSASSCSPQLSTWDTASRLKGCNRLTARSRLSKTPQSQPTSHNWSHSSGYWITMVNLCLTFQVFLPHACTPQSTSVLPGRGYPNISRHLTIKLVKYSLTHLKTAPNTRLPLPLAP